MGTNWITDIREVQEITHNTYTRIHTYVHTHTHTWEHAHLHVRACKGTVEKLAIHPIPVIPVPLMWRQEES